MRNGMRWPLLALLLPQQFNEPTADCISSLIDLSEHANAHADRINPTVTHCLHNNAWTHKSSLQTTRKLMEKRNPLLLSHQSGCWADRLTYLTGKSEWINSGRSHNTIRIASCWIFTLFGFIHVCGLHVIWIGAATCFYTLSYYFFPVSTFPRVSKEIKCS